ncbi:MAG: hypothetical protein RLZZ597_22 [Cyanobacteriota bacterium]|jgi:hypothetical protein
MTERVTLVDIQSKTSIHVHAEIAEEGELIFSGQDIGEAPESVFGDSDYEYCLTIPAEEKDRALLAFIEKLYSGYPRVVSEVQECLELKGIKATFSSY